MVVLPLASECVFGRRGCELDVVIEWVEYIDAAFPSAGLDAFRLESAANACFVPIGNRVTDVIDHGLGLRRRIGGIADGDVLAALAGLWAEHDARPVLGFATRGVLHAEDRSIKIAGLGKIRAQIHDMIDAQRLEAPAGLGMGGIAGGIDQGGKRHGLTKFAAIHLAAVEVLDEISYESFHGSSL